MTVLDTLRTERDQARDAAIALAESDDFDPEASGFKELESRAASLDSQIEHLSGLLDKRQAADALDGRLSRAQHRQAEEQTETRELSWGESFVRSDVFTTYPGRGTSSRLELETRALPMTTEGFKDVIAAGPMTNLTPADQPNLVLNLASTIQVSSNAVEYVTYSKAAGGADVVAEGALKPSVEYAAEVESKTLQLVAVWTQLTRMLIEDAQSVRGYIDGELRREVIRKQEAEAVEAITGATLPTTTGPADTGMLGAIRAGMAQVQAEGFRPNGFLVSANDLIALDLAVMQTAGTGPNQTNSFWGLTPVVDTAGIVADGTTIVGDFKAGVVRYNRTGVSLYITDSHADTFTKNVFTLLAEARDLTAVVRPNALSEATAG